MRSLEATCTSVLLNRRAMANASSCNAAFARVFGVLDLLNLSEQMIGGLILLSTLMCQRLQSYLLGKNRQSWLLLGIFYHSYIYCSFPNPERQRPPLHILGESRVATAQVADAGACGVNT